MTAFSSAPVDFVEVILLNECTSWKNVVNIYVMVICTLRREFQPQK